MKESVDKHNMRRFLLEFPGQFEKALVFSKGAGVAGEFGSVIVSGMGGSALPGDLIRACLPGLGTPVIVSRDYGLPKEAGENSLVFASSYSGNTEETLSAYKEARDRGMKIVGFCSGGMLEDLCKKDRTPCIIYPKEREGFQPRFALGYAFTAMVMALHSSGIIGDFSGDILGAGRFLEKNKKGMEREGSALAEKLAGRIPVIYSSEKLEGLARVWKINFNENAKMPAFYNCFPEMNHNEMVGYTNPQGRFHALVLKDRDDHPRILKRMDITSGLIKSRGVDVTLIDLVGGTLTQKVFSSIYLAGWASYCLALNQGTDPTPINMVEDLKKRLA
jgi:glucose/mannose-6-phosphate isomerase